MPSRFGWVDFAEEDRERMLRVVDLFGNRARGRNLGIGTIRDAFAKKLLPGHQYDPDQGQVLPVRALDLQDLEWNEVKSAEVAVKAGKSRN